jgi:hypothetical protein
MRAAPWLIYDREFEDSEHDRHLEIKCNLYNLKQFKKSLTKPFTSRKRGNLVRMVVTVSTEGGAPPRSGDARRSPAYYLPPIYVSVSFGFVCLGPHLFLVCH